MPQLRTTRHIRGVCTLTTADVFRPAEDSVCLINDFDNRDSLYEVPLGCLVSEDADNLLAVGRAAKDRTASGRVRAMTAVGTKGRATLTGTAWRSLLGLKSTLFSAKLIKDSVTFTGFGAGHGLGISQWGAKRLAETGKSYADILHHYYTGVTLQRNSY